MPDNSNTIIVADADPIQRKKIGSLLGQAGYFVRETGNLGGLQYLMGSETPLAAIIDIDSLAIDNRQVRHIARTNPNVCLFCVSSDRFHPELEDAIRCHFYACLVKPVDPDELFFLLKSIRTNRGD